MKNEPSKETVRQVIDMTAEVARGVVELVNASSPSSSVASFNYGVLLSMASRKDINKGIIAALSLVRAGANVHDVAIAMKILFNLNIYAVIEELGFEVPSPAIPP